MASRRRMLLKSHHPRGQRVTSFDPHVLIILGFKSEFCWIFWVLISSWELSALSISPSLCGALELAEFYYTYYSEVWKKEVHMEHDLLVSWNN
ncbi:hypothetical protein MUK42_23925 [Musa troglodytarum]|uniref:Uncharacterized protein n=1 Tax=Musa troglodytarum TaxID=320322 RepID=A0A9E7LC59_9LILI|nr:hypothetical protein MUK42_23925 [Musa troglodytarum]